MIRGGPPVRDARPPEVHAAPEATPWSQVNIGTVEALAAAGSRGGTVTMLEAGMTS